MPCKGLTILPYQINCQQTDLASISTSASSFAMLELPGVYVCGRVIMMMMMMMMMIQFLNLFSCFAAEETKAILTDLPDFLKV